MLFRNLTLLTDCFTILPNIKQEFNTFSKVKGARPMRFVKQSGQLDGQPTLYICRGRRCLAPMTKEAFLRAARQNSLPADR